MTIEVGAKSVTFEEFIDGRRIAAFRKAVGVGVGESAAPTFLTSFRRGESELLAKFGVPLPRVLHGEQEYAYGEALRAGDRVIYRTILASSVEKKGNSGAMTFLVFETPVTILRDGTRLDGGYAKTTIVVRAEAT